MRADNRAKMCGITGEIKHFIPTLTMGNEGAGCAYGCCGAMGETSPFGNKWAGCKDTRCGLPRPKMGDEK